MRVTPKDILLLILLGIIWGISFMAIKAGLTHLDPIWFAALRYDIAALVMLLFVLPKGIRTLLPVGAAQWKALIVSAALNVMGYHAFLFWGEQYTTSAVAAVVISLNPIAAMVVARAALPGERVGAMGLVGLLTGILGIIVLVGLKPGELLDARGIGELVVFGAVVSWALGAVYVKKTHHGMPVLQFTVGQMFLGALMLHALSLGMEGLHPKTGFTAASIAGLLYLSVLASGLGFLIYFTLLERIGPIRSSLVSYIAPAAAAVAGWVVLGESLEMRTVFAFLLIIAGFRLVIAAPKEKVDATAPHVQYQDGRPVVVWDEAEP